MHETLIANNIIEEARKRGEVESLELEIGELAHVPPHELIGCLEELVSWKIHYKEILSEVRCECGFEGHPTVLERGHDFFMIECPECGEVPELLSGTDVKLVKVTLKD